MVLINYSYTTGNSANVNDQGIFASPEYDDEIFLDVSVTNPITRRGNDGEYVTTYAIFVETNDTAFTMNRSMVRRRYSEFVQLRNILQEQHRTQIVPKLPGKTILGKRFDQRFINERCRGLELFLKSIFEQPLYLSNKCLHLFIQTSLSMNQIQRVVDGIDSFELPHNNESNVVLVCPVETSKRLGILKTESRNSLVSCSGECQVKEKHSHIRVGSGIFVCPFLVSKDTKPVVGSAPFNIQPPNSSSPQGIRSCSSDTCLDGGVNSIVGSKKRVSFLIAEKQKGENLLNRDRMRRRGIRSRRVAEAAANVANEIAAEPKQEPLNVSVAVEAEEAAVVVAQIEVQSDESEAQADEGVVADEEECCGKMEINANDVLSNDQIAAAIVEQTTKDDAI